MKKIVLACLTLSLAGLLFAVPVSNKNASTKSLFTTDVDNFADVNNWDSVQPENLFGYMGYKNSAIDFGLAHQFKKFYGAFYFNGALGSLESTTTETSPSGGKSTKAKTTTTPAADFTTGFLYGSGDIGAAFDFAYNKPESTFTETSAETTTKSGADKYTIKPILTLGFNNKTLKSWNADYRAKVGLLANVDKSYQGTTEKDDSSYYLGFGGGMDLTKGTEKKTDEWDLDAIVVFGIYPSTIVTDENYSTTQDGKSYFSLNFTPEYTLTYKANEKTTLKAGVSAAMNITNLKSSKSYSTSGVTTYPAAVTSNTVLGLTPSLQAAVSYTPELKKIKFPVELNAGIGVTVPELSGTFKTTEALDGEGKVSSTTKSNTFKFVTANGACSFTSGFTAKPLSFLTLDCTYNLLAHVFGNDFTSDFSEGSDTNLWNTANKALVHNVSIIGSIKL